MDVTVPSAAQVAAAIELIVALQASPTTACSYLGTAPDGIRAELDDLEVPWRDTLRVAVDGHGTVVGAVIVDWDEEIHRSWIHGPWTRDEPTWAAAASALLAAALALIPPSVDDHEVSAAPAHAALADLMTSRGWAASEVNIAFVARSAEGWPAPPAGVRPAVESDLGAVAAIHDEAFPATYATARRLLAEDERVTLVLEDENGVIGYASAEVQADGTGYLDFIALAPSARGRGVAAGLLSAIGRTVLQSSPGGCVNLTVKESNASAVRLYERFGFQRDAELVGYRTRAYD